MHVCTSYYAYVLSNVAKPPRYVPRLIRSLAHRAVLCWLVRPTRAKLGAGNPVALIVNPLAPFRLSQITTVHVDGPYKFIVTTDMDNYNFQNARFEVKGGADLTFAIEGRFSFNYAESQVRSWCGVFSLKSLAIPPIINRRLTLYIFLTQA